MRAMHSSRGPSVRSNGGAGRRRVVKRSVASMILTPPLAAMGAPRRASASRRRRARRSWRRPGNRRCALGCRSRLVDAGRDRPVLGEGPRRAQQPAPGAGDHQIAGRQVLEFVVGDPAHALGHRLILAMVKLLPGLYYVVRQHMSFKYINSNLAIALHADRRADLRGQTGIGRWLDHRDADLARSLSGSAGHSRVQVLPVLRTARRAVVLFDNERGKGDHSHIGEVEGPYCFEVPETD